MSRWIAIIGALLFSLAGSSPAQQPYYADYTVLAGAVGSGGADSASLPDAGMLRGSSAFNLTVAVPVARMSPELALTSYLTRAERQLADLGAYSDITTVEADLPQTAQHGKFELRRYFQAPHSLAFAAVQFAGDSFVKTNVIARLLQSEVDHVQKGEGVRTAITGENYKFKFAGAATENGRQLYIYHVKPRHKRPGLFKGRIVVDAATGQLRRAEGTMVKTPSFFVKKVDFVQDYAECGPFSMPAHIHSEAQTRLLGRAVVDVFHRDYKAKTAAELEEIVRSSAAAGNGGGSN